MTATIGSAPLDDDFGGRVDQVVDRAIEEERIVGAMILIARRGEILYSRAAGLADRESKNRSRRTRSSGSRR